MDSDSKKYDSIEFEDNSFVSECLEAFDEDVAKVEEEYATAEILYTN